MALNARVWWSFEFSEILVTVINHVWSNDCKFQKLRQSVYTGY